MTKRKATRQYRSSREKEEMKESDQTDFCSRIWLYEIEEIKKSDQTDFWSRI